MTSFQHDHLLWQTIETILKYVSILPIVLYWNMLVSMREKCDNIWRTLTFEMKLLNINIYYIIDWASLVAQRLKRLPAMQETRVRSLGREDPLEKKMSAHSSILAWRIPGREEPGRLQSTGLQRVGHDWATSLSHYRTDLYLKKKWEGTEFIYPFNSTHPILS